MAANRIKGVRAAVFYNGPKEIIELSRQHNNANILSLGARFMSEECLIFRKSFSRDSKILESSEDPTQLTLQLH